MANRTLCYIEIFLFASSNYFSSLSSSAIHLLFCYTVLPSLRLKYSPSLNTYFKKKKKRFSHGVPTLSQGSKYGLCVLTSTIS